MEAHMKKSIKATMLGKPALESLRARLHAEMVGIDRLRTLAEADDGKPVDGEPEWIEAARRLAERSPEDWGPAPEADWMPFAANQDDLVTGLLADLLTDDRPAGKGKRKT